MSLQNKIIVLGVGGGIAAYKACDLIRRLREKGSIVHVILTKAGAQFITPLTLQTLSGNPVGQDLFNLTDENRIGHIELSHSADLFVVAPATADLIAKISHGLCDDLLTTSLCATKAPVVMAPSMNVQMWQNSIVQENIGRLEKHHFKILPPESGDLACGDTGFGRLPEPNRIVEFIETVLCRA